MTQNLTRIEEQLAHLTRLVEDLSDVIARQDRTIDKLERQMAQLRERAASRELEGGAEIPLADQKPPHW